MGTDYDAESATEAAGELRVMNNNKFCGVEEKKRTKNAGLRVEAASFIPAKVREEMVRLVAEDSLFLKEENEMRERMELVKKERKGAKNHRIILER